MKITLLRFPSNGPTIGVLLVEGRPLCLTLELPWKDNAKQTSCIPTGKYRAKKTLARTTNGGLFIPETLEVVDVPDRSGILFHVGNTAADTNGCILVGESFGYIKEVPAVLRSKAAFASFLSAIRDVKEVSLVIRNDVGYEF